MNDTAMNENIEHNRNTIEGKTRCTGHARVSRFFGTSKLSMPERYYLILCFVIYMFWMFVFISRFYGPDEYMRFNIPKFILENKALPYGWEESLRDPNWGISYGFDIAMPYLLSACFMWIASLFTQSEISLLLAARLTSALSMVGAGYFAIQLSRKVFGENPLRWIFIVLSTLLPQIVFLGSYAEFTEFLDGVFSNGDVVIFDRHEAFFFIRVGEAVGDIPHREIEVRISFTHVIVEDHLNVHVLTSLDVLVGEGDVKADFRGDYVLFVDVDENGEVEVVGVFVCFAFGFLVYAEIIIDIACELMGVTRIEGELISDRVIDRFKVLELNKRGVVIAHICIAVVINRQSVKDCLDGVVSWLGQELFLLFED